MSYNNGMNERGFTVQDYKDSISAEDSNDMFTLAYQWQDKKHRHVWDLCNWIEQLQAELDRVKTKLSENLQTAVDKSNRLLNATLKELGDSRAENVQLREGNEQLQAELEKAKQRQ